MSAFTACGLLLASFCSGLPAWEFEVENDLAGWHPNAYLAGVAVRDGVLHAATTDWDPFFSITGLDIETTPWQYLVLRVKASRSGEGELFWSGATEGKYGGLSQDKSTRFQVPGDNAWHEVAITPFWHREGRIRQLRLDLYDDASFEIDYLRMHSWKEAAAPVTAASWICGDHAPAGWGQLPGDTAWYAPPLDVLTEDYAFIGVKVRSNNAGAGEIIWASDAKNGAQGTALALRGDGQARWHNIEVQSLPSWQGRLYALGFRMPSGAAVEEIQLATEAIGPPELILAYAGFENAAMRAGREAQVLIQIENLGGDLAQSAVCRLDVGEGMTVLGEALQAFKSPEYGDHAAVRFQLRAGEAGTYRATAALYPEAGAEALARQELSLTFLPERAMTPVDYVPAPRPVATPMDICMYYFPGWQSDAKWDCVRTTAPIRKPLLGYYDESNPECVDWQIKWAVENGIDCFLVDWYWVAGKQHLTHWFEAYRKARYRDQLQVAIMWANHNPPNTHSREDWRQVTQEWLDHYFTLPSYYQIKGKPALFLWSPYNLRHDLGGSGAVKEALDESRAMAKAAGFAGIEFIAVNGYDSPSAVKILAEEGYQGGTNYHEWGHAKDSAIQPKRYAFSDVAATAPARWEEKDSWAGAMTYYPVVDTGWDSRPWHGDSALVIEGRTTEDFEALLREAKTFSEAHEKRPIILGPANEWGEGSYVEPNLEFGFSMYEAVRRVFAEGNPAAWPENLSPADCGLGPYDFLPEPSKTVWDFEEGLGQWQAMMAVGDLRCEAGALVCATLGPDPALTLGLRDIQAKAFPKAAITMTVSGEAPASDHAQLFWALNGQHPSEATSISFPIQVDGKPHTYTLELYKNPRWRGRITQFRFDPANRAGLSIAIDRFALLP